MPRITEKEAELPSHHEPAMKQRGLWVVSLRRVMIGFALFGCVSWLYDCILAGDTLSKHEFGHKYDLAVASRHKHKVHLEAHIMYVLNYHFSTSHNS